MDKNLKEAFNNSVETYKNSKSTEDISSLYRGRWTFVAVIALLFIGSCVAVFKQVHVFDGDIFLKIGAALIIAFFLIFFNRKNLKNMILDFPAYRKKQYKKVVGKVIGFRKNEDPNDGIQRNNCPYVEVEGIENLLLLETGGILESGETYAFLYLEHTGCAQMIAHYYVPEEGSDNTEDDEED
mgnify:CR=1 FL=1